MGHGVAGRGPVGPGKARQGKAGRGDARPGLGAGRHRLSERGPRPPLPSAKDPRSIRGGSTVSMEEGAALLHVDLCSGIGGFALAASWMGWQTVGFCEIDPFAQRVLRRHFPDVPIHGDLTTLTARDVRGWVGRGRTGATGLDSDRDAELPRTEHGGPRPGQLAEPRLVLTAGYPCQPFSVAGKRRGAGDARHLWPHIAALLGALRAEGGAPDWCVFENVAGHVRLGLDDVLSDLEALGYACGTVVVPACAVGALHRRDRLWIVAHAGDGPLYLGPWDARREAGEWAPVGSFA